MDNPRRSKLLRFAPAIALFTVMAVPWLTTQAQEAQDARIVPFTSVPAVTDTSR